MAEYSRMAKGSFTASGTTGAVLLPFQPDYVELWNLTNIQAAPTANKMVRAWWDNKLLNVASPATNPTMMELYPSGSTTFVSFDTIANSAANPGINAFSGGLSQQFGPAQQIVSATAANPAVFTVTAHGYQVGDTVIFRGLYQSSSTGMAQMNNIPFTISAVTTNTFTVKWNASTSNYTALSGSPASAFVQKVLYPFLYLPQDNVVSALTLSATTTVVTTMYHNFLAGQEIAFRIPSAWGTVQLNSLPNILIPGQPIYGYITSVTDNWTFVVNINSTAYTAYTANQTIASVPGLTFPQVLSVGDVNTGGEPYNGGALYPAPLFPTSSNRVSTINGPAIRGAFVNNTAQGFTIGAGVGVTNTSATLMTTSDIILWHAYFHDYANP
jgi:hypothetical protein